MGHRWRCKCGYAERGVCARVCLCMRAGGRRISAFPALGGGGNSESPGEGDPSGWPGRDRGSTIRRLLFLRRGRDRRGDCSRLEVSALARSSAALPPPMFFLRLSGLENSLPLALASTFSLVPSHFRVLSLPPLALTLLWLRFTWRLQCSRVSSISVKPSMMNKDETIP